MEEMILEGLLWLGIIGGAIFAIKTVVTLCTTIWSKIKSRISFRIPQIKFPKFKFWRSKSKQCETKCENPVEAEYATPV